LFAGEYASEYAGNLTINLKRREYCAIFKMKINEIFYSIQGEGKWTGLPNIFIRTTGCNLRCKYCDTKYAYFEGEELKIEQILNKIKKYNCKKICITGGEPLLQKELNELLSNLEKNEYVVLIETNGSLDIKKYKKYRNILFSVDIKCPSSEMHEKTFFENIKNVEEKDQIKFVIDNKTDYDYAKRIINKFSPICEIIFQPVYKSNQKALAEWILKDNLNVKLGLQIHKIIWGDIKGY